MAQTDGLQGETGKNLFKSLKNESEHIKYTHKNPERSRNGDSQMT